MKHVPDNMRPGIANVHHPGPHCHSHTCGLRVYDITRAESDPKSDHPVTAFISVSMFRSTHPR